MSDMVVLYAEFTALPGREAEVATLVRGLSEQVRREPGNVQFVAHQKREDTRAFFVYEEYRDRAAFEAHIGADYGRVFNKALNDLIVEDGSALTWLSPL